MVARTPFWMAALLLGLAAAGCSGARRTTDVRPDLPDAFPNHSLVQIRGHLTAAADTLTGFSAKASLALRTPDQSASVSATIQHRRADSLYMSLSPGLGIEAARALVTPDSFYVYDRLKKRLTYGSLAYAAAFLPVPLAGDDVLRSLLGLTVPEADVDWRVEPDSGFYHLTDPSGLRRYVVDPARWRVVRYEAHTPDGQLYDVREYAEFDRVEGLILPRRVVFERPLDDTRARIFYRDLDLNPETLSFSFSVSDDAERVLIDRPPETTHD